MEWIAKKWCQWISNVEIFPHSIPLHYYLLWIVIRCEAISLFVLVMDPVPMKIVQFNDKRSVELICLRVSIHWNAKLLVIMVQLVPCILYIQPNIASIRSCVIWLLIVDWKKNNRKSLVINGNSSCPRIKMDILQMKMGSSENICHFTCEKNWC